MKSAVDFPATDAPITDADIQEFIFDAEEEIEKIYKTKFGNVEDSGTATSGTVSTLTDSGADFTAIVSSYEGYVVWITGGTGSGQYREIVSNTSTVLTVSPNFDTAPDATSTYRVTKLGYKDETVDGSGTDTQFVVYQPLIALNALSIDGTSVTPSNVYQYFESGRLLLGTDAEVSTFLVNEPQLVNTKYVYGVYPMPRVIKRLAIIIAALKALTAQIAGTYDDFSSVSLPGGVTGNKGEPYVNIEAAVSRLQSEAKGIIYGQPGNAVTGDFRSQPSYRPFVLFG